MKKIRLHLNTTRLIIFMLQLAVSNIMTLVFLNFLINAICYKSTAIELTLVSLIELVGYISLCYLSDMYSQNKKTHEQAGNLESQM